MAFVTDKQTLDDLGIFGKQGSDSVFTLFNRTCTGGGAALLEEMFMHPLSDAVAINGRIHIIQQFAEQKIVFPFNTEFFGLVEHYLENTDERTKITHEHNTISKRFIHFIQSDAEYKLLHKGVTALKEILTDLWNFVHAIALNECPAYVQEKNGIIALLTEAPLLQLVQQKRNDPLTHMQVAEYDTVFRFKKRAVIKQLLQFIYSLDVYIAVANVAAERKFGYPQALPVKDGVLQIQDVYHPLLKQPVANTVQVTPEHNIIFLTGANMAGKSTFMKTIGIAMFLAHMGFPVPAGSMLFTVMDGLYTTINLPDNLGMGASHFYAEVLRVKKVAKELALSKNLFIIFDELFRGTNVKDAYEATIAIIAAFAKKQSSVFIISTHIIEAGPVLKEKCSNMQFLFLPTRMQGNTPIYPYTLEKGITNDRHGMIIIRNEGILEILKSRIKPATHELCNR